MKGYASIGDPDSFGRMLILRRSPTVSSRRDEPPLTLRAVPTPPAPIHPVRGEPLETPEERDDLASLLAEEILFRARREAEIEAERGGMT